MLDRIHALRPIAARAALTALAGAALLLAACTPPTTTPATGTANPTTACTVRSSDLALAGGGAAKATTDASLKGAALAIDGSTALAPLFSDAAKAFDGANATRTSITPNGSGTGLKDVEAGAVQIGLSDFFAKEKAPTDKPHAYDDLVDHQVAAVAFSLVVSSDLRGKVTNLTKKQIQQIYTGVVTNWSQVGGPNEAITVINRTASSGTRFTFKKYVLDNQDENAPNAQTQDTSAQVATSIAATQGAIAYVANGFVVTNSTMAPICIDGYSGTAANINAGKYPFWAYEHAYTKGQATGAAKALLDFMNGADFQSKDLAANAYIQAGKLSDAAKATHPAP
ncbi:MAG TPA: phosphate ABC transporter substrate-binding protein [Ktedonobacterales bacterium]